jgi:hypothetical protein
MNARILSCSDAEYYADSSGNRPSLSQSTATTLILKSPAHAWLEHPRLGNQRRKPTAAMDEGTLMHRLLLGVGAPIEVLDFDSFRTKAAQEARDSALAAGAIPVKREPYEEAEAGVARIRANMADFNVTLDGTSEVAYEWESDGVLCRAKMDHVNTAVHQILDLKKMQSCHPRAIQVAMVRYGIDIQWAAYTEGYEAVEGIEPRMDFVCIEFDPPYAVVPVQMGRLMRELGRRRWGRAKTIWQQCLTTNSWPGYATSMITVDPPQYTLNEEMMA